MDITLWLELILFAVLMGFSGFFSSSETSLFSLNKVQLEQMRRDDNPRIGLIERMLSEPRRLIVTILIGNEFVNVAASVISAAVVIQLLGAENKFVNLFIMVPILLLVGEITPKTLAIRNNVAFATFQSRAIEFFARLIKPLRVVVRLVADWFTTFIVGKERSRGNIVTEDMVRTLAYEAVGDGVLDKSEARYIDQIFEFGNKTLEDVLTPRSNVLFLSSDMSLSEMIAEVRRTRHTKIPVYEGDRDTIVGILYARDLLGLDLANLDNKQERQLLREPYFVPETKPVGELFHTLRKRKQSLAMTVDEYGGVTGLVSMEDLLECIFGEIRSASDETTEELDLKELADGSSRLQASMPIEQFNQDFGGALDDTIAETVGGLLLHEYGELPPEGTRIVLGTLEFTVVKVGHNRVEEVTVVMLPGASKPDTPEPEDRAPTAADGAAEAQPPGEESPDGEKGRD